MASIQCKMCGGSLNLPEGVTAGECPYCGTLTTFPKLKDEQTERLYNRAEHFRLIHEFDKAIAAYEELVRQDDGDPEFFWGLVLCRYGIEYVEDPVSHQRIPTCHRVQYDPILTDADYLHVLELATGSERDLYEEEAKKISEIQKSILTISAQEKPYDVFICYKETTDGGTRTKDSTLAQEIYYQLTNEGYKVFFARITLEDKLGTQYEPYIFAALNSAKVMLVIGSRKEFFEAVWVKNEWSRFLALMKKDRTRLLIPCYRDMDPYDLPQELSLFQSQDMSKIGFIQDLLRGVKKVLAGSRTSASASSASGTAVSVGGGDELGTMLKRARILLQDGKTDEARGRCDKILDKYPESGEAFLLLFLIEMHLNSEDEIAALTIDISGNSNFRHALEFSTGTLKASLEKAQAENRTTVETEQRYQKFLSGLESMLSSREPKDVFKLHEKLKDAEGIIDYRDTRVYCEKIGKCLQNSVAFWQKQCESARSNIFYGAYQQVRPLLENLTPLKDIPEYAALVEQFQGDVLKNLQERFDAARSARDLQALLRDLKLFNFPAISALTEQCQEKLLAAYQAECENAHTSGDLQALRLDLEKLKIPGIPEVLEQCRRKEKELIFREGVKWSRRFCFFTAWCKFQKISDDAGAQGMLRRIRPFIAAEAGVILLVIFLIGLAIYKENFDVNRHYKLAEARCREYPELLQEEAIATLSRVGDAGAAVARLKKQPDFPAGRIERYRKAEQGDAASMFEVYREQQIIRQNAGAREMVLAYLKKAAESGIAEAQVELARRCMSGDGVPKNPAKAFEWYEKAAKQGNAEAQFALGGCYEKGIGVTPDKAKAFEWYEKAANQGKAEVRDVVQRYEAQAGKGDAEAQYLFGLCCEKGIGVTQNTAKALEWYKKAAKQGNADAQYILGEYYEKGIGVTRDTAKAFEWYEKAAAQGKAEVRDVVQRYETQAGKGDAEAQHILGLCYEKGIGVTQDPARAFEWYEKSAEQGNAGAQYALGGCYEKGIGVTPDKAKAFEWYEKAANQGSAQEKLNLARRYESVPNSEKAFEWYEKAAEQGNAEAQYALGGCYEKGIGVTPDKKKAIEWYEKAAKQGNDEAQYALGGCYEKGIGMTPDKAKAYGWYKKAAKQGNAKAQVALKSIPEYFLKDSLIWDLPAGVRLKMVFCPAGSFMMGSPKTEEDRRSDEVQHRVTLSKPFLIGKYEVTQAQYRAVTGNNPSNFKGDDLPVEQVSWEDAMEFCEKLNSLTEGRRPKGYRFSLPTEAQWEYAARGGDRSRGFIFSGSNTIDDVAWVAGTSSYRKTHMVGTRKANELGICDMSGNVWEWCLDWYGSYGGDAQDPKGPSNGSKRVIRGGGCIYDGGRGYAENCRSAFRNFSYDPGYRDYDLGFRLALVPE